MILYFPGQSYIFDREEFRIYSSTESSCPPPADDIEVDYNDDTDEDVLPLQFDVELFINSGQIVFSNLIALLSLLVISITSVLRF